MNFQRTLLILMAAVIAVMAAPSYAGDKLPKTLKKIAKGVDLSDPVQAAVFAALKTYEQGFAPLVGEPVSTEERERIIQDTLAFAAYDQAKSRMDHLRDAEIYADSMHRVTASIPDAKGYFWAQEVVQPGATSKMQGVYWTFDVPFDSRISFAQDLYARLGKTFGKDKKWMQNSVIDPKVNSMYGQMMYFYMLNMLGSKMVFVTVEYGQTEKVHELTHGVKVQVYTLDTFN